ncbi:MAG: methionine-rich copper-binding protein CopC, partial [Bacteroidia bacterium]
MRNQIVFLLFLLSACAKQSTPMGGPRDLDAPKVISIYPEDKSLNTKPTKIQLEFDEYIKLDNATKNII